MSTHPGWSVAGAAGGVVAALALGACGAAPQEAAAEAPPSPAAMQPSYGQPQGYAGQPGYGQTDDAQPGEGPAPTTRDDAIVELDQAEAELFAALERRGFAEPRPKAGATPPSRSGATSAPKPTSPSGGQVSPGGVEAAAKSAGGPCATACRALASMNRAADHLCGLAGESDARCSDARTRVKSASDRVQAQCPACAP